MKIRTIYISGFHLLSVSYGSINWMSAGSGWQDAGLTGLGTFPLWLCQCRPPPAASAVHADAQQVWPIILAPHEQAEASSELQEYVGGELLTFFLSISSTRHDFSLFCEHFFKSGTVLAAAGLCGKSMLLR